MTLQMVAAPAAAPPHARRTSELPTLVAGARRGDEAAWTALVRRFEPLLRRIARGYRLTPAQVDDAVQSTWVCLVRSIGGVREPEFLTSWLATAVRRESLRLLQSPTRELLSDDPDLGDRPDPRGPEADVLEAESRAVLAGAIATLPERHRQLMTLLSTEESLDYREISARAGVPVGSIGPIRGRSLVRLARDPALRALYHAGRDPGPHFQ
jgi:RNA polymerase sigma factor (sigma-70 family)